ncbi:TauD/TfdA family dioxygenase [Roseomonas marmotae]|uniref:TauD/TfdA family dioxygenase n=1 Tax=Roseomonas marmotae TaxID=2768161 RepID=A0ABS3KEA8_9PROT|nr:TauD/TfdA family dioxygenase [Roseomonas marmotae]MBO1074988.1 TauD/TfdA family dioxygenase [Roseomonas marmotae]QTI79974.1 TauD/TfdA family dioxygenase [Roseomonas marmotae]
MVKKVVSAADWRAADIAASDRWVRHVTPGEVKDLMQGFAALKASGKSLFEITREDVSIGSFAGALREAEQEMEEGIGFKVLRGLPVQSMSVEDNRLLFWAIGTHLGVARPQGKASQVISDVRDAGGVYRSTSGRGYNTNAELDYHTDGSDVVALLCRNTARNGGLSRLASSVAIHNALVETRPDLAETLYGLFPHSRQNEEAPDEAPTYMAPVYSLRDGHFASRYIRNHIRSTQMIEGQPKLTPLQHEALDALQEMASSAEFSFDMWLEPGDLQLVNNHVLYHSRTHYEDFEEEDRKRHLFRLWLAVPNGRPLTQGLEDIYKSVERGTVRGGIKGRGVTPELLAYQARAAQSLGMRDIAY